MHYATNRALYFFWAISPENLHCSYIVYRLQYIVTTLLTGYSALNSAKFHFDPFPDFDFFPDLEVHWLSFTVHNQCIDNQIQCIKNKKQCKKACWAGFDLSIFLFATFLGCIVHIYQCIVDQVQCTEFHKLGKPKFFSLSSTCLPALFTDINAPRNHHNALYFTRIMKNYRAKFLFCWHKMHCSRGSVHWGLCNMHTFLYAFNWDKWRNDINEISKIIYKLNPL